MEEEELDITNTESNALVPSGPAALHSVTALSGMYQDWFLDYASYVILERAVPHLHDGLKPVQRRILHSMKRMDDGRYNKVANIIGHTMQFHPHGDASIGDALGSAWSERASCGYAGKLGKPSYRRWRCSSQVY